MNYFALFELLPTMNIDEGDLKRRYLLKSREYHPDFFTQASESEQLLAIRMTAEINTGYKVISEPQLRLAHILELHDVEVKGNNQALPQEFLFEMMDLNERIEIADSDTEKQTVIAEVAEFEMQIEDQVQDLLQMSDLSELSSAFAERLKSYYLKRQYLKRLRAALK